MKGCMLIHGFTGSPHEVEPLARYLREHTNWIIYTPTLAGHGPDGCLKETTYQDWISSAAYALQQALEECDEMYLVGFSMGGLIASHLAGRYPVAKLVLLSTAVYYVNPQQFIKEMTDMAKALLQDQGEGQESLDRVKMKWRSTPLQAVVQFRRLVRALKPAIKNIAVPVLIIHGEKDHIVNPKSAQYIYDMVQSVNKKLVWLKNSKHIVCHDCEQEELYRAVEHFLVWESRWDENATTLYV